MKKLIIGLLVVAGLTSCTIQRLNYSESSARSIEPNMEAIVTPLIAEPELLSNDKIKPFVLVVPGEVTPALIANIDAWKRVALSDAAKKYNADALIGTMIDVKTENNRLNIIVTGWPIRYTNFRKATEADTWISTLMEGPTAAGILTK